MLVGYYSKNHIRVSKMTEMHMVFSMQMNSF
jgi:hypothetical protein